MIEKDDAVSTVIALMLILGIVSTLVAIYSAAYLPGLKQQSEIEHSREVADAFARFGSDIEHVISQQKPARFSEPFSLGGGGILLSPVRSSGSLTIAQEPLVNVTVTDINGTQITGAAALANISYVPSFTTWEPQGYCWEYGFVAVTKDGVAVPQSSRYNTISEARDNSSRFLQSFVELTRSGDDVEITLVNLSPKENGSFVTGSGIATLGLNATVFKAPSLSGVTEIVFEDLTSGLQISGMGDRLAEICAEAAGAGAEYEFIESSHTHRLTFDPNPATVTFRTVNVEVSVW